MKKLKNYICAGIVCLTIMQCNNILEPTPQGQVELDALLSTEQGMLTAVNGMYSPLQALYENSMPTLTDRASDDGWTWRKETETDIYIVDESFGLVQSIWALHYNGITRANTVLSKLPEVTDFSDESFLPEFEGQAKFLRAYYYFNLVRFFGGIPIIIDEIEERMDAEQPRASIEQVYAQIKSDLDDAISLLPIEYSGAIGHEDGRVTKLAAAALQAKVHMELEEWEDAVSATGMILDEKELLNNYADNFNGTSENGPASIFEVQYGGAIGGTTTSISNYHAPPDFSGLAATLPTDDRLNGEGGSLSSGYGIVQEFEDGDLRRDVILADYGLSNFIDPGMPDGSLEYVHKFYNEIDQIGLSTWNFPLIRYADILLLRSEALNELSFDVDGEAFDLLNQVREKANLPGHNSTTLPDQESFRDAVRRERRIELSFECNRYFDLNRWGILEERIQAQMDYSGLKFPSEKSIHHPITGKPYFLYPIPLIEFANNAQIKDQNPGY